MFCLLVNYSCDFSGLLSSLSWWSDAGNISKHSPKGHICKTCKIRSMWKVEAAGCWIIWCPPSSVRIESHYTFILYSVCFGTDHMCRSRVKACFSHYYTGMSCSPVRILLSVRCSCVVLLIPVDPHGTHSCSVQCGQIY